MSNIIRIEFDRVTGDYTAYVDESPIGCETTAFAAEMKARAVVFARTAECQHLAQLNAKIAMFSDAYAAANAAGRLIDAARYRREGMALIAERRGITTEQLTADMAVRKAVA